MELRQLRYLIAIAETGNVRRAAARVHISQPALSQQIRKLEGELGTPVLERHGRGARLTPAAEVMVQFGYRILREVDDAHTAVRELTDLTHGHVHVGTLQALNTDLLPRAIAGLIGAWPGIRVAVSELSAQEIETGVRDGALDFGVTFTPVSQAAQSLLEAEPLFDEELALVVGPRHPLQGRRTATVRTLERVPLALLPPRFAVRVLWDEAAAEAGVTPSVRVESDTITSLLAIVRETELATVLPALSLSPQQLSTLSVISLQRPTPVRPVGLIWRKGGYRSHASQALADRLLPGSREKARSRPARR
ncbi:MAG: LysR substrate-binding domain-containing protein [Gammaproteobacteria bacterium]|jgi:LysR family transcriptional regulator, cyn operon transcriptional activator